VPLQRVLHAAARLVLNLRLREHVTTALWELQRIEFKLCLLVHKIQLGRLPRYLSDLSTLAADVPGRPSVQSLSRGDFIVPRTSHKFRDRVFSVAAPWAWNRLTMELFLPSTPMFKRKLKAFLFTAKLQN